jgi:hypothetical protein
MKRAEWPARQGAIVALALMLGYFAIDNHVPLYPWNNLAAAGPQWQSTLAGWLPGLFTVWALAHGSRWGVTFGAGWTVVWLLLQMQQWWLPYLFGPTPLHRDFRWYWAGGYALTLHILPARGARPVPNAEHLVLQALSLTAAIFTVRAALRMRARARMASPPYFHFAPSRFSYAERRDRIREIINNEHVLELLPPTFEVAVRIEAPIAVGVTLSEAHSTWIDAGSVETPYGLPRQPPNAQCPHGLVRVAVECVKRRSGGMGSFYGFEGYFVSLLVLIEDGKIWDARGDVAS